MRIHRFPTFLAILATTGLVEAEVKWTDCEIIPETWLDYWGRPMQWDIALDMLNITNRRLNELYQAALQAPVLKIPNNKPSVVNLKGKSDEFVSAFRTVANLLSPQSTSEKPYNFKLIKDGDVYSLIDRALRLGTVMEYNMRNTEQQDLNLQISCDSSWLKYIDGNRYRDGRPDSLFKDPAKRRIDVEIPWELSSVDRPLDASDNGRLWSVLNGLSPPFSSVVSLNSFYVKLAVPGDRSNGRNQHYEDLKREATGKNGVPSFWFSLPGLTHNHLPAWLVGAIAASQTMTTDQTGVSHALPVTNCHRKRTDSYAHDQLSCVLANSRNSKVGMADLNFQYLVLALYMEQDDYSTGWNRNLLAGRQGPNEGLQLNRDNWGAPFEFPSDDALPEMLSFPTFQPGTDGDPSSITMEPLSNPTVVPDPSLGPAFRSGEPTDNDLYGDDGYRARAQAANPQMPAPNAPPSNMPANAPGDSAMMDVSQGPPSLNNVPNQYGGHLGSVGNYAYPMDLGGGGQSNGDGDAMMLDAPEIDSDGDTVMTDGSDTAGHPAAGHDYYTGGNADGDSVMSDVSDYNDLPPLEQVGSAPNPILPGPENGGAPPLGGGTGAAPGSDPQAGSNGPPNAISDGAPAGPGIVNVQDPTKPPTLFGIGSVFGHAVDERDSAGGPSNAEGSFYASENAGAPADMPGNADQGQAPTERTQDRANDQGQPDIIPSTGPSNEGKPDQSEPPGPPGAGPPAHVPGSTKVLPIPIDPKDIQKAWDILRIPGLSPSIHPSRGGDDGSAPSPPFRVPGASMPGRGSGKTPPSRLNLVYTAPKSNDDPRPDVFEFTSSGKGGGTDDAPAFQFSGLDNPLRQPAPNPFTGRPAPPGANPNPEPDSDSDSGSRSSLDNNRDSDPESQSVQGSSSDSVSELNLGHGYGSDPSSHAGSQAGSYAGPDSFPNFAPDPPLELGPAPNPAPDPNAGSRSRQRQNQNQTPDSESGIPPISSLPPISGPGSSLRPNTELGFDPGVYIPGRRYADGSRPGTGDTSGSRGDGRSKSSGSEGSKGGEGSKGDRSKSSGSEGSKSGSGSGEDQFRGPRDGKGWPTRAALRQKKRPPPDSRVKIRRDMGALVEVY